jgi:hypothetical protein
MRLLLVSLVACSSPQKTGEPRCNPDAKIVLGGQDDVDAARGCLTIESLTIRTGAALDLTPLQKLHVVLGDVSVGPSVALEELRLPQLYSAGTITITGNGDLHGVILPKLASARAIRIEGNVSLSTIAMPALAKVTGDLVVAQHAELGLLDAPALETVGGELRIIENTKLTLVEAGKLQSAAGVRIENNAMLDAAVVDALRAKAVSSPP